MPNDQLVPDKFYLEADNIVQRSMRDGGKTLVVDQLTYEIAHALATQQRELLEWVRTEVIGEDERLHESQITGSAHVKLRHRFIENVRNELRAAQRRELGERENAK